MTVVLLVGLDEPERALLAELPVATRAVAPAELDRHLPDGPDGIEGADAADRVDVVVVSGMDPVRAVASMQQVHRRRRDVQVAVLVTEDTAADVRQHVRFAADVPADLQLLPADAPDLADHVVELCRTAALRRSHQRLLADIGARHTARTTFPPVVRATLGTLLENAPLGVLVADREGRLLACNRAAADLLRLPQSVAGTPVSAVFPDASLVDRLVAGATTVDATDPWPEETTSGPRGARLDVSAATTHLEDGREVVLFLVGDATARAYAEHERDLLSDQVAMMGRVSEVVVGTQDPEEALHLIAEQVVPTLGDWVSLQLYDDRGATRLVVARHRDSTLAPLTALVEKDLGAAMSEESPSRRLARGEPPILLRHIGPELLRRFVPDTRLADTLLTIGVDSAIAVPLEGRQSRLGSMVLINRAGSRELGQQELAIAVEVGRRVGIALETLHLYTQQRVLAEELQRSMLTEPPTTGQAEIAVRYKAAAREAQVGGDWYDAYLQTDGSIVLSIGDVVGHDYRAAAAMGQLRGLLRGIGYAKGGGPAEMLRSLDAAIEGLLAGVTATAVVAHVAARPADSDEPVAVCWSNAGHPPPLLVPHDGDPVVLAADQADVILGVAPELPRQQAEVEMRPGDTLVLYSDGLIERRGRDYDEGIVELREVLARSAGMPLESLCDHLLAQLVPTDQDDDVALVAVRLRGPASRAR